VNVDSLRFVHGARLALYASRASRPVVSRSADST
jgi:hypothetical protein